MKPTTSILVIFVVLIAVMASAGCTGLSGESAAAADYHQKLSRSQEALENLNASYQSKVGVMMDQPTFKAHLEQNRNFTLDLISASNETVEAGHVYLRELQPDSTEYKTVVQNEEILKANVEVAKEKYNSGVYNYNKFWGGSDSEFVPL